MGGDSALCLRAKAPKAIPGHGLRGSHLWMRQRSHNSFADASGGGAFKRSAMDADSGAHHPAFRPLSWSIRVPERGWVWPKSDVGSRAYDAVRC